MANNKKGNGALNGSGKEPGEKIVRFPTLAERDRQRKEKQQQEKAAKPKAKSVPFFNFSILPPFTRICVLVFLVIFALIKILLDPPTQYQLFYTFGFVPGYFTGTITPTPYGAYLSPFTHMFIHGSWMHLFFNTIMMLSLGMFFEREFGTRRTAVFFFVCGLAGALAYFALNPFTTAPVIGASGGISGLFGALIILLSKRGGIGSRAARSPWPLILFWVAFMIAAGFLSGESLAWQAHIGGFLAGIGLLYLMQSGKIKFL